MKFVLTGLAALLAAPAALAQPSDMAIGATLTDEPCAAAVRSDMSPPPGLPLDRVITCSGKPAGALEYSQLPLIPAAASDARKATLAAAFAASRQWSTLRERMSCEEPKWLDDGKTPVLVVPCRTKSGGFPNLVVVHPDGPALAVADGPASLYPVLRALVKSPAPDKPRTEMIDQVRTLWREPVVLASAVDIDQIKTLLREARTAAGLARYDDAEGLFRKALDVQTRLFSGNDTVAADILMDLALNVSNQGRADEAEALFRRAAPVMEKSPYASDRARLDTYRGYEAANRGDYAAALQFARSASSAWRAIANAPLTASVGGNGPAGPGSPASQAELAMALNLEAAMLLRTGDVTSAYAAAGEALLLIDKVEGEPRWWKADVLATLGDISSSQGRMSAAENFLLTSLSLRYQIFGEGSATLRTRAILGRAYHAEGMNSSAIITFREALKVAKSLPQGSIPFTTQDLVPFASAVVDYAATLTDQKEKIGLYTEAFDAFQMVRSPLIDRTVGRAAARLSAADPAIAELLRQIEDKERAQGFTKMKLAHEQSLASQERSALVEEQLSTEYAKLGKEVQELRLSLESTYPAFNSLQEARPLVLDEIRKRLGPTEGVVSFMVGRDASFVQLLRRDSVVIGKVPVGEAALKATVAGLRRSLEIQGTAVTDFNMETAHQLYADLFGGVEPAFAGLDRLVVVPSGPLSSLPFGLLVTTKPASDDYVKADWLVKRMTLTHAPSLAAFMSLRSTLPARRPDLPLLAFGDPSLGGSGGSSALRKGLTSLAGACRQDAPMPPDLLRALSSLPDTATELRTVQRTLGGAPDSLFTRNAATEAALRGQTLDRYRVLYFATHGLLPGELKCQAEPGLVLSPPQAAATSRADDGLLETSEIAGLSINADLVVLSACNTAASGASLGGEAMSGLSESFFHAGARNMIVSHWQVPSGATMSLMSGLFTRLGDDAAAGAADALRKSQVELLGKGATSHPFFWAAFVLMGGGAAAPVETAEVKP